MDLGTLSNPEETVITPINLILTFKEKGVLDFLLTNHKNIKKMKLEELITQIVKREMHNLCDF